MSLILKNAPVFFVVFPLFIAVLLPTLSRKIRLVEFLVAFVGSVSFIGALFFAVKVLAQNGAPMVYALGGVSAPWGIELKVDALSAFFILVVTGVSFPISLFGFNNLSNELGGEKNTARFYTLYLLLIGSLCGMALTNDMFNIYVLVEVATLSCCGLVSAKKSPQAAKAAFSYLILASIGSALILGGIGFIYILTGHLNMDFANLQLLEVWQESPQIVWMAFSFMLVGFGVKTALFPLHIWLPDAHSSAAAPASAILSGLAVKGYLICLLKVLYNIFGTTIMLNLMFQKILIVLGMTAIIGGSLLAIMQDELKRRLAYSTVAQIGYLYIGLGLVNKRGFAGLLLYLAGHAICKSILFLSSGAIIKETGKHRVSELSGIGRQMPITMAAFSIATLGLIGIPLFSGFIGKWNLIAGSLEAGEKLPVVVIILGSVLCAAYLLPIIRKAYFSLPKEKGITDPPVLQKASLIILMVLALAFGFFPDELVCLAQKAATQIMSLY
ncbi:MAG TPA: proton-conducting transporter membrane subunit [Oscillospiraceae bacterium]|nr:proton-conducting transporter membrane subunit [Oscillospiraceae bacterium]